MSVIDRDDAPRRRGGLAGGPFDAMEVGGTFSAPASEWSRLLNAAGTYRSKKFIVSQVSDSQLVVRRVA